MKLTHSLALALCVLSTTVLLAGPLERQKNFEQTFGYDAKKPSQNFSVVFVKSNAPANVFWPGESAELEFQIINKTAQPLSAKGNWQIIQYGNRCGLVNPLDDVRTIKIRDGASVPVSIDVPAKGFTNVSAKLPLPEEFGAYAVILSLEGQGQVLAAECVRTVMAESGKVFSPAFAMDMGEMAVAPMFQRVGIRGARQEWGAFALDDQKSWEKMDAVMKTMADNNVTVMLTLMSDNRHWAMGCIRGLLNDKAEGKMDYPGDFAALPQFDGEFQQWVKAVAIRYGWPTGPLNAVELWNEPWEGSSISGWGADMPRYRELYTAMAQGIEQARKEAGVQVLIGGACSSMNTEDKLFGDGNDLPFLKWLDFTSIHYQPLCSEPVLIKRFAQRKHPNGPTRVWDTESWTANSEDRIAGMLASMRAQGLERTAGVFHDYARDIQHVAIHLSDGKTERHTTVQALAPSVGIAATNHFMGQRKFKEILFKNGLPWIFVFDGLPEKGADDGTVVVVGDLGSFYDRDQLLFRGVLGLEARKRSRDLRAQLAALPADATEKQINAMLNEVRTGEVLDNASMTVADADGHFMSFDSYGNPIKSNAGKLVVPLNGQGYFVRTDGSAGSFAKLLEALRSSRIDGLEPVDIVAHDLLGRVESKPQLKLTITNILNRPITGQLNVKLGSLHLENDSHEVKLEPNQTTDVVFKVAAGSSAPDNTYQLHVGFDGGGDGQASHDEAMHVNVISKRTIEVDGKLDDWKDVLPQPIRSRPGSGKNLTEKAWLPFAKFDEASGQGFASGYLAYDDHYFYFAARIADSTPYLGNIRFAKRDDDSFYYPDVSYAIAENPKTHQITRTEKKWPDGVRHYSYRRNPDLPSGSGTDNVQIAFNVLPVETTDWLANPPGVMPRYMCYKTTDYEYALNPVAEQFGGGEEIWRLLAPGVPRKHFYPRQNKAMRDGGPVTDGKLIIKHEGNTRIVECAIPWTELPDVHDRLVANQPIKFTFRVNDNKGPSYELNGGRSVSKIDTYALHDYWATSWAVETEFAFEK